MGSHGHMQTLRTMLGALFSCICFASMASYPCHAEATAQVQPDPTWQFSVPLEAGTERRAYLWIPPRCRRVRGVLFGLQNMLERDMFEDPAIRSALASADIAIVLISPGAWPDKSIGRQPSLDYKDNPTEAVNGVKMVLAGLAKESGYSEIKYAPLLITGHSAASPFIWGLVHAWPERIVAFLPFKGYPVPSVVNDIPTLKIEQEWAEWGPTWGEVWRKDIRQAAEKVHSAERPLFGDAVDVGSGHFDWHHDLTEVLCMFIRKAAAERIPTEAPLNGSVTLRPVDPASGVLVDPASLGTKRFTAVPYSRWQGDPRSAFWYFDQEMAETVNRYMLTRLEKKPEAIDFVVAGKPVPLDKNGFAAIEPEFLADGITFRVTADALSVSPSSNLFGGQALGHASTPIVYRVSSGALRQVGPDTFQVAARSGGLTRQGLPWEPWIMAYQPGDSEHRSADRPAHILIAIRNTAGQSQTLTFEQPHDVARGTKNLALKASTSSGLPPQFYVESGPAFVEGSTLRLLPIPPRTHLPVRIIVSAYQWGRAGTHPVQSAGPITREFFILKH